MLWLLRSIVVHGLGMDIRVNSWLLTILFNWFAFRLSDGGCGTTGRYIAFLKFTIIGDLFHRLLLGFNKAAIRVLLMR